MKTHKLLAACVVSGTMIGALLLAKSDAPRPSGLHMAQAAVTFLTTLTQQQRAQGVFAYDDPERLNWHYIPRPRKGLPLKTLEGPSLAAANALIASGLSQSGYEQALSVMSLEEVLYLLETGDRAERRQRRDPKNYFVSIFGIPSERGVWGWRLEGHHLSLNYTVSDGRVAASTPEFFGANPAVVDAGPGRSIRVLAAEEDLAREIVRNCTPQQRKAAVIDAKAPNDIRDGASRQPGTQAAVGLAAAEMSADQRTLLKNLLAEYLKNMPADVRAQREAHIEAASLEDIRFAWWGGTARNEPHAYRVQGPTFLIEYNNTQNNANHVHSVWRNPSGDFNRPINSK